MLKSRCLQACALLEAVSFLVLEASHIPWLVALSSFFHSSIIASSDPFFPPPPSPSTGVNSYNPSDKPVRQMLSLFFRQAGLVSYFCNDRSPQT